MYRCKPQAPEAESDDFTEEEELMALIDLFAMRRAEAIVAQEAMALVQSAREKDEAAIRANSERLVVAIAQAVTQAYYGDIEGVEAEQPA